MPTRKALATWQGDIETGNGDVTVGALTQAYSYKSRLDNTADTNAEELLGAAQASCYAMALAAHLEGRKIHAEHIDTTADVTLEVRAKTLKITHIELYVKAQVPSITLDELREHAHIAKEKCPIAQALAAVRIDIQVELLDASNTDA